MTERLNYFLVWYMIIALIVTVRPGVQTFVGKGVCIIIVLPILMVIFSAWAVVIEIRVIIVISL